MGTNAAIEQNNSKAKTGTDRLLILACTLEPLVGRLKVAAGGDFSHLSITQFLARSKILSWPMSSWTGVRPRLKMDAIEPNPEGEVPDVGKFQRLDRR